MKEFIITIYLLIILVLFLITIKYVKDKHIQKIESFSNNNYLYPIKGLSKICAKENLKPSFMPKACFIDGKMNSYANCKCEDEKGNCKICYDTIKKDTSNANVVYDSTTSDSL